MDSDLLPQIARSIPVTDDTGLLQAELFDSIVSDYYDELARRQAAQEYADYVELVADQNSLLRSEVFEPAEDEPRVLPCIGEGCACQQWLG